MIQASLQLRTIVSRTALGLVGKARPVQRPVKIFLLTGLPRKGAACPIRSVCPGRESDNQQPGARISKGGNRFSPILLVPVSPPPDGRNLPNIASKPGTGLTGNNFLIDYVQRAVGAGLHNR